MRDTHILESAEGRPSQDMEGETEPEDTYKLESTHRVELE